MPTTVKNLNRLNRKVRKLPQAAIDSIRVAMAQGANEIVAMAKRFAPVDTGTLRDSIGWTWGFDIPEGATALGSFRYRRSRNEQLQLTIYAGSKEAYYARWKEFGTVVHKAHPFFFPAYRAQKKLVKSRIRKAARLAAKKVAGVI